MCIFQPDLCIETFILYYIESFRFFKCHFAGYGNILSILYTQKTAQALETAAKVGEHLHVLMFVYVPPNKTSAWVFSSLSSNSDIHRK